MAALPDFLAEIKYQDYTDPSHTPMQKAWKIDLPVFMWVQTKPENHAHFNRFMEARHQGMRQWWEVYPVEEKLQNLNSEQVAFVDVGGGIGHDSVIIIDDMVLPDTGVHWNATQVDMTMMVALASRERTAEAWSELMEKARLKIQRIYTCTESLRDSILECVPV